MEVTNRGDGMHLYPVLQWSLDCAAALFGRAPTTKHNVLGAMSSNMQTCQNHIHSRGKSGVMSTLMRSNETSGVACEKT